MDALLAGSCDDAMVIFKAKLAEGHSLLATEVHLLQPALYQIGRDWQCNTVSVAQEHLATATAITLMSRAFTEVDLPPSNGKRVLCACVEGNQHAVGLRMVADAFELDGWSVCYLGPNRSSAELVAEIEKFHPTLVCLSLSMPHHLPVAKEAISRFHATFGSETPAVMVGGLAINAFPDLAPITGADDSAADAEHSVPIDKQ